MSVWLDLRVAVRHLAKSLGATALAVLSIALGIGLTAGVFSVADAMLLRPLAIERPSEVYDVESHADDGQILSGYGWPDYLDMADAGRDVVTLVACQRRGSILTGDDGNLTVSTHSVTPNYFSVLGVRALAGTASVEPAEGRPRAVLGYQLWQRRFAGDPHIVGKTILLNQKAFLVAGVMPREFTGLIRGNAVDVWISADAWFTVFEFRADQQTRDGQFEILARLKPGATAARAGAVLDAAIRGVGKHKAAPAGSVGTFLDASYALGWQGNLKYGGGLLLLLGAVLFVACANVVQLRLAQAEVRKKEMGVRLALGAGGWRITRQLLIETALLSLAGASLGVVLAQFLMQKAALFIAAGSVHVDYGIQLNHRVLAFTLGAALLSVLLTGLAPARHVLRLNVSAVLRAQQGSTGRHGGWQRRILVVGQVAVSVALFGCAVLFVESYRNAAAVWPGLDPAKHLLVLEVSPGAPSTAAAWCEPACSRLAALPGVRGATYARRLPLSGSGGAFTLRVEVPGRPPLDVPENNVGGNYFAMLGTRLLAGRGIQPGDREGSLPVVVVSRTFARQLMPGDNPLGQWISVHRTRRQVVGIAEDAPADNLHKESALYLFLPYQQVPLDDITLMVETAGEPAALERAVRQELKSFDSRIAIYEVGTLRRQLDEALSWDTTMASLSSGLGVFGILLTAAGLFGVLQYSVNRRKRELGLRMALGAKPAEIHRMILRESLGLALWGIPIGLALLGAAVYYARSAVLGVSPLDPRLYAFSAAAAFAVTLLAGWLPARRATRVDPMEALRTE
jgi:predicted permease